MAFYTSLNPTVFKVFMEFLIVQSLLARLESACSLNEGMQNLLRKHIGCFMIIR